RTLRVAKARRADEIKYPRLYRDKAEASEEALIFNCTQRAHQNTLESIPTVLLGYVPVLIHAPYIATCLCSTYPVSRIIYTFRYTAGDPSQ
ncbi:hypothetical protein NEOLEDRAFT_1044455, partial [Neolentinus lepideus HHB14362 ss-1]